MREGRKPAGTLERIVVTVPDPQETAAFFADGLDLEIIEVDDRLMAVCEGEYHAGRGQGAIELVSGVELSVRDLVFALPADAELGELSRLLGATRSSDTSVSVVDPTTEIRMSFELESNLHVDLPPKSVLRPRRMGHVNLKSPSPTRTANFLEETLGLRLSEYIGEDLYWLRTGSEHHNVALRPGGIRAVHHLGLEVGGWHAYQPVLDHLDNAGFKIEYGPGRHRPGRSLFVYVCDPSSGLRIELFSDMVHILDDESEAIGWQPGDRMTKTLNTWGPLPPPSFME
ncbi:VOC family protein [Rhodococcus sp. IEGM 1381]|uniref:VOC family protein n=1 Tax=Rhodococcus sp. IEGM 1381 TaxID=3047085 RepID=UPI0024B733EF|nr:VOC family protein [Rhodococcus sp. IEGM 1381]MDI9897425.1 VOC family protein [Rhodococcus sp. IEGM 1381]